MSRIALFVAVLLVSLAGAGVAVGLTHQARGGVGHHDFHGTVVWAHRSSHMIALRTRTNGLMRFATTARTRYDHMGGFDGCRQGRHLAVHARRAGGRWMALELKRDSDHGAWHDGHHDGEHMASHHHDMGMMRGHGHRHDW